MSDKGTVLDTSGNPTKGLTLWEKALLLFYLFMFILLIAAPNSWMEKQIQSEIKAFNNIIGDGPAIEIYNRTNSWWNSLVKKNQLEQKSFDVIMPERKELSNGIGKAFRGFFEQAANTHRNFWLMVYQSMFRISVMWFWIMFAVGLIVAGVVDGFYKREIKRYTFGWTSANIFRISYKYLLMLFPIFGIYLSIPIIPDYVSFLPVILYVGMAIALSYMVANMNKVF